MSAPSEFIRKPIRAIFIQPFNSRSELWQASYAGDEWTGEMLFYPPMRLALLKAELFNSSERRGLPIVVLAGKAEECAT